MKLTKTLLAASCLLFSLIALAAPPKLVLGYWSDWNIYSGDPTTRAIPEKPYGITGSYDTNGSKVVNSDLDAKLNKINAIAYAFLEVSPSGTLYFNDPNSDLRLPDPFCDNKNPICYYKQAPATWGRGNFEAFAKLQNKTSTLRKLISVGGYGHDQSFEYAFANMTNFVESAYKIVTHYKLSGIDLDYEPTQITAENGKKYADLIEALRKKLGNQYLITATILANPKWINSIRPTEWQRITKNTNGANYIQLMTYDFHGAFDYPGDTGYLTNLYLDPNDKHTNKFSVNLAVEALEKVGVPSDMIVVGVPAYGRALENVGSNNNGLYQTFKAPVPRGDLDAADCKQGLPQPSDNACSGTFQYKYIVGNMLAKGFTDYSTITKGTTSGVWAYNPNKWNVVYPDGIPDSGKATLSKTFISYANTNLVKSMTDYVHQKNLGGLMMWELRGDVTPGQTGSLLDVIDKNL